MNSVWCVIVKVNWWAFVRVFLVYKLLVRSVYNNLTECLLLPSPQRSPSLPFWYSLGKKIAPDSNRAHIFRCANVEPKVLPLRQAAILPHLVNDCAYNHFIAFITSRLLTHWTSEAVRKNVYFQSAERC